MSIAQGKAVCPSGTPVLTFLISLRHPTNSADYDRVERLARRTLRSLEAQTDRRCEAVVVANRLLALPPGLSMDVRTVVVDFPAPSIHRGPSTGREAVLLDKGTKLAVASSVARSGHVMFVDADDFVNVGMTAFVGGHPQSGGWYVDEGLVVEEKSGLCYPVHRFNELCGTSLIIRRDLLPCIRFTPGTSQEDLLRQHDERTIKETFGSHRYLAKRLSLQPLPLMGAAYAVGTGENHSGKQMVRLGRPLSGDTARRFGIEAHLPWVARSYFAFRAFRLFAGRVRGAARRILAGAAPSIGRGSARSSGKNYEG